MSMDYSTTVTVQPNEATEIRPTGYLHGPDRTPWASVSVGPLVSISQRVENFDHLLRVADAIYAAVERARQLQAGTVAGAAVTP